jgi:protein ImuB
MSQCAQQAGIQAGMRRSSVQMLMPEAVCKQREIDRENASAETVAIALLQYSPQVSRAEQASILINIGASLSLFGGIRKLCRLVMKTMAALGISATLGCAATARGAWLLAHAAASQAHTGRTGRYCLSLKNLPHQLDALQISLLPAARPWLEWLHGIGIGNLGALRQLPRAGVQRRCGKAILHSLDCAYAEATELHQWIQVAPEFKAHMELPDRIEHAEAILNFARSLLLQLCGWLTHQQLAVSAIELHLEHERGRMAIAPTRLKIALAEATWKEEHLSRLLKERLAQLTFDAPVIAIRLHASQVVPMQVPSASLFPEPGGSTEDGHRLLELLVARLGAENVLQAASLEDHRPEVANQWVSVQVAGAPAGKSRQTAVPTHPTLNRPAWLLPQAIALEMRQHSPCYGTRLTLMSPAERIEAGWWNGQLVTRDYFVAENAEHQRYWIYRERVSPSQARQSDAVWYLHGVFG